MLSPQKREESMETNEWKADFREKFNWDDLFGKNSKAQQATEDFISQNFIPKSGLAKWVEENEDKRALEPSDIHESGKIVGHNSALKELEDRFLSEHLNK